MTTQAIDWNDTKTLVNDYVEFGTWLNAEDDKFPQAIHCAFVVMALETIAEGE